MILNSDDNRPPHFHIMLSTYNGGNHLQDLLNSICNQTYKKFTIYIRDDGSSDYTLDIITSYIKQSTMVIKTYYDNLDNLGPSKSFNQLLQYVIYSLDQDLPNNYFLFADQDDYWLPNKLEIIKNYIDNNVTSSQPSLIYSDLEIVDSNLKSIHSSFMSYQGINPQKNKPHQIALINTVVGCTAAFNSQLARLCLTQPKEAIMHDWWLALVAAAHGRMHYIDLPLVRYRQHTSNSIGAHARKKKSIMRWIRDVRFQHGIEFHYKIALQTKAFIKCHSRYCGKRERFLLKQIGYLATSNKALRTLNLILVKLNYLIP